MKNEIYVLKWYVYDCSSYELIKVNTYLFYSVGDARNYLKQLAYKIYVDNEGDGVSIGDWDMELYDNYGYEIIGEVVLG